MLKIIILRLTLACLGVKGIAEVAIEEEKAMRIIKTP
jgi:hypothetical protein